MIKMIRRMRLSWTFVALLAITTTRLAATLPDSEGNITRHAQLLRFVQEISNSSDLAHLEIIGQSVEGRDIPAIFITDAPAFGVNRGVKPIVLIHCQQHGDEPSGKEAALLLAKELTGPRQDLLKGLDVILVPQVNPDGAELDQRQNANNMDLNRNHAILSEPETEALHKLFRTWMPEVTLDVHEYEITSKSWIEAGYVKYVDEQLGGVTNLNVSSEIAAFSRNIIIPNVGAKVVQAGYSFHRYIVGSPFNKSRLRYSTTAINDGRQSFGIYNTFSFILEGKRYGDAANMLQRRTQAQFETMLAFLEQIDNARKDILAITKSTRGLLTQPVTATEREEVVIQMDYFPDSTRTSVSFPIFNFSTWRAEDRDLAPFAPLVKPKKSIVKPAAYIFSRKERRLSDLLARHQIITHQLKKSTDLVVEGYLIRHISTRQEQGKEVVNVDAHPFQHTATFKKGDIIVPTSQHAGNLIPLMLEPQSSFSIVTKNSGREHRFEEYLVEGDVYPIYRLGENIDPTLLK